MSGGLRETYCFGRTQMLMCTCGVKANEVKSTGEVKRRERCESVKRRHSIDDDVCV
jgi:hypothetical protein